MTESVPLSKKAYEPQIRRETDSLLKVFVMTSGQGVSDRQQRDRCELRWQRSVMVCITRRLDDWDDDETQPATYAAIDECVENVEYIAEQLGAARQIQETVSGDIFSLGDIEIPLIVSDDWLRQSSTFYSEIILTYD